MNVKVTDILAFLVGSSAAPSSMGAQLDRLRYGVHTTPDPFRARDEVEAKLLEQAVILRCIDDLERRVEWYAHTKFDRLPKEGVFPTIEKLQKASKIHFQGQIVLGILRAYHQRCSCKIGGDEERGLAEVYRYVQSIAPEVAPALPKEATDLATAFRTGTAKRARALVCEAYADALLALERHVAIFNKSGKKTR